MSNVCVVDLSGVETLIIRLCEEERKFEAVDLVQTLKINNATTFAQANNYVEHVWHTHYEIMADAAEYIRGY